MRVLATGPSGPLAELDPLRDAGHEVIIGRPLDQPGREPYTEAELIVPLHRQREDYSGLRACGRITGGDRAMKFKVVLEPSDEGGFTVHVPSLPGCISEGETEEEALRNIKDAIELYLEPTEDETVLSEKARVIELVM